PPSAERQALLDGLRDLGYAIGQNVVIEATMTSTLRSTSSAARLGSRSRFQFAVRGRSSPRRNPDDSHRRPGPSRSGRGRTRREPRAHGRKYHGDGMAGSELIGKQLELLKEAIPKLSRVAVLWSPVASGARQLRQTQSAAKLLGVTLQSHEVKGP